MLAKKQEGVHVVGVMLVIIDIIDRPLQRPSEFFGKLRFSYAYERVTVAE